MAPCSGITMCLSEGSTECYLASEACPPCMYAISGGDYSCYNRDTSSSCPFSGAYAECDVFTTPSETFAPTQAPETVAEALASTGAQGTPTSVHTNDFDASPMGDDTPVRHPPKSPPTSPPTPPPTPAKKSADAPSPDNKGTGQVLASESTFSTESPAAINFGLIGAAVVFVVVSIGFVTRRRIVKKKLTHSQQPIASTHNSQWSNSTLDTDTSDTYAMCGYKNESGKKSSITMLSDSQASTYDTGYTDKTVHKEPLSRTTADFSNYGGQSKFAESSSFYTASEASSKGQSRKGMSTMSLADSNFVDVTASSINSGPPELPLTVSELMNTAILGDGVKKGYGHRQKRANRQYSHALPSAYDSALPPNNRRPQMFAVSTASSMRSDYDIVDPATMRDGEARDTEVLAKNNCYPKFSFASEADIYDGSSSDEEGYDRSQVHEHMI